MKEKIIYINYYDFFFLHKKLLIQYINKIYNILYICFLNELIISLINFQELNLDLVQFPKPVYISEVRIIPLGARVQADFPGGVRLG